jgi:hypothetical protein
MLEQQGECSLEHDRRIAVRHCVAHQILRSPQFLVGLATYGELNLVTLRREGLHLGLSRCGWDECPIIRWRWDIRCRGVLRC